MKHLADKRRLKDWNDWKRRLSCSELLMTNDDDDNGDDYEDYHGDNLSFVFYWYLSYPVFFFFSLIDVP